VGSQDKPANATCTEVPWALGHPATTLLQAESVVAGERLGDWPVAITSQIQTSLASARLLRTQS